MKDLQADMQNLVYTLLLTNNQKCSKCLSESIYILIGRENEFLGFFCEQHGKERHTLLESKYNFESESPKKADRFPRRKRRYIRRKR